MHSPKSSLQSNPFLANDSNRDSTFLQISSDSDFSVVVLLMNLSPLRALWALELVRLSLAFILRASRADTSTGGSSSASDGYSCHDSDLSHDNFLRILNEDERLLAIKPPPAGGIIGFEFVGVTLQTKMESSSSCNVTSTKSAWSSLRRLKSSRKMGSIAPAPAPAPQKSSGKSNLRL